MMFLDQVKEQLSEMTEAEKDAWILSQAKLMAISKREDFLMSLSGEKKIIDMPRQNEIEEFCKKVEAGDIYVEYETHYYEFDDDGRYMDDWKIWYEDPFEAMAFLDRVFAGCHDLLLLEEYQEVNCILGKVLGLRFQIEEAAESEDYPEEEKLSLSKADEEGMLSFRLGTAGEDWIRATARLQKGQEAERNARKFIEMLEHPACRNVKPRILLEEGISQKVFFEMEKILNKEISELERKLERDYRTFSRKRYELTQAIDRKQEILLDVRIKCSKKSLEEIKRVDSNLEQNWNRIKEVVKWLNYEKYIDDQPEIDEIQDICEELIHLGQLDKEEWKIRKKVLEDIIYNDYYEYYNCGDIMEELAEKLCTNKNEYLAFADVMAKSNRYKEKAAYLYHQYGVDDKYVSYLEGHLDRRSKEYSALIAYYQEKGLKAEAQRVAQLGLERCKEDLTDCFICLLLSAKEEDDQKKFQKLFASAKRRKNVDVIRVNKAVESAFTE